MGRAASCGSHENTKPRRCAEEESTHVDWSGARPKARSAALTGRATAAGIVVALALASPLVAQPIPPPPGEGGSAALAAQAADTPRPTFSEWLAGVRAEALTRGIREEIVDAALADVSEPLPIILERDRAQAETVFSLEKYLSRRLTAKLIQRGRDAYAQHRELLDQIAARYGVPPRIIVAIWGVESNYGRFSGVRPAVSALATLAWDPRRATFFRGELFNALEILNRGDIDLSRLRGSWAGAMGQVQFMPSSYLKFAEDFDGDGRRDIWSTPSDVFASIANYLQGHDWTADQTWGREVRLTPDAARRIAQRCRAARRHVPGDAQHDRRAAARAMAGARRPPRRRRGVAEERPAGVAGVGFDAALPRLPQLRRAARLQLRPLVRDQRGAARRCDRVEGAAQSCQVEQKQEATRRQDARPPPLKWPASVRRQEALHTLQLVGPVNDLHTDTDPMRLRLSAVFLPASVVASVVFTSSAPATDIVVYASTAPVRVGAWNVVTDPTAAGGAALHNPDLAAPKRTAPLSNPTSYFELPVDVVAGQPYHLWIRGKAQNNAWANDSVYMQFADPDGLPTGTYGRGTASAAAISIEDCSGCGLAGWGWQDQAYGTLAPNIVFERSGMHTIRVQPREDGITIDQIVLSPSTYLSSAPGALKNDNTRLPASSGGGTPAPPATFVRQPFLQQTTSTGVRIVWATRELQSAAVQTRTGTASPVTHPAAATSFPASATGMAFDYYQYEAAIDGLQPSATSTYTLQMNGTDLTAGADQFTTAPPAGTGTTRFIAFGDSGVGSAEQYTLAGLMTADRFDLALHTGDIVYGNSAGTGPATHTTYHSWFFEVYRDLLRGRPLFPTIGNHDNALANGRAYRDLFVLPDHGASPGYADHAERFYSFDYGRVHFVSLDSETAFLDTARRQAQIDWLRADLAATTADWKVVFFHRPPYSTGFEHGSDLTVRAVFPPIFEQYGVQLVINGHDHDYERTIPLKSSTDPAAQAVTYIVTGGGGSRLYTVSGGSFTAFARSAHHYVRAEASECHLTVQPIGLDGVAFDTLTLERCGTAPSPDEIVVHARDVPPGNIVGADWSLAADATAAGGLTLKEADRGRAKLAAPAAQPPSYVDVPFSAAAGVAYHFWFRMKALNNATASDSVYVQFSGATNASSQPIYPVGSTAAASVILENGSGAGLAGWGWTDSSYGSLAASVYFATPGPQTLRIQTREDGVSIDQIVISAGRYLTTPPGAVRNDNTVIPKP